MGALKSLKCSKGHKMKDPNLYYTPKGIRYCRQCRKDRDVVQRAKRKKK